MIKIAGGSVFLGTIAILGGFLFYLQPTVEAVTLASESQTNLTNQFNNQTNNQDSQTFQKLEQTKNQTSKEKSENKTSVSESSSFRATAYCLKGRTATGGSVRRGIVAADPRVLPLGSRIQINAGAYSGTYTVADTGGSVRGRILDIWVPSCSEAMRFGRRSISVSKLGKKG